MGTKKSQTSETTQATLTASTTASQTTPVTPSSNRTRGRNTAAQSSTADKAAGATKSQTENQQSQFAVPETVRRSGRKTTLPKNLIHDSVIETPSTRNRRESAASKSSRRRNSSASSSKSSRKKQPVEKRSQTKESSDQTRTIKLEGQILTSSDEEFPKSHKKGSLYGWRRLPPMTPPAPGRKTWEGDSGQEEQRGTRGNLGWGPVRAKEKDNSEVEDSQEEGGAGFVSPLGQDEAAAEEKAEAQAAAPAPLAIESDTDRDYDAELSELESSPVSTRQRTTSEVPDGKGKEDVEELQEQRPPKRRRLVLNAGNGEEKVEEAAKPTEALESGPSASKPKKAWVLEDYAMGFVGNDVGQPNNGVEQKDEAHMEQEITQARAAPETGEAEVGIGVQGEEIALQKDMVSESPTVLNSPPAAAMVDVPSVLEGDYMDVDGGEIQNTTTPRDEADLGQTKQRAAGPQLTEPQAEDENPNAPQDTEMMDEGQQHEVSEVTKMEGETTNGTEAEVSPPAPEGEEQKILEEEPAAVYEEPESMDEEPEVMEEDAVSIQEEVNPLSIGSPNEPIWISSSQSGASKYLQPTVEEVTDEEDLPGPGATLNAEAASKDAEGIAEEVIVFEEDEDDGGEAVTPDEISTPDEPVTPDEIETAPGTVEPSEVGDNERDGMEVEREEEYEVETVDGEARSEVDGRDIGMQREEVSSDVAEVEEAEESGEGEEMGIVGIEEVEADVPSEDSVAAEEGKKVEEDRVDTAGIMEVTEVAESVTVAVSEADEEEPHVTQQAPNDALQLQEAELPPSMDTTNKEPEREASPVPVSLPGTPTAPAEEVEDEAISVAPEEPIGPEAPPEDMEVDEEQENQQERYLVEQQDQDDASPSSVEDHIDDAEVEKFRELSLGANGAVEGEVREREETAEKEIVESTSETISKTEELTEVTETIDTKTQDVVDEIEVTVSRTEVEIVEAFLIESKSGETTEEDSLLKAQPAVDTQKEAGTPAASTETPCEPEEAKQPIECDDHIMEDAGEVDEHSPTMEDGDQEMQEAMEAEEEVAEKASEVAEEAQVGDIKDATEDQIATATESKTADETTTVTAQQDQEQKRMEQETEERKEESVAEEPNLPYRPVDDLGAENNTFDDDDHITLYSSSSGLPSDDELGPDGITRAEARRSRRRRRSSRSKAEKAGVKGVIDDQRELPQIGGPALDIPPWNGGDDNVELPESANEPQLVSQIDMPEHREGSPVKDLGADDRQEPLPEFTPESPTPTDEDINDIVEPEINEDVGLPPDLEAHGSEGSGEEYDNDRDGLLDAHLLNGGGLMDLLRAAELVEAKSLAPLQTRKEVLPSRTFKMYGDAWERMGNGFEVIPKLPKRPEIPESFPDNIVNLGDWEGIQYTKCPACSELLADVIVNAMENAQTTQNTIAEHIENCGKQKESPVSLKSKARESRKKSSAPPIPAPRTGEGVRRINLRVRLSDGTYLPTPSQTSTAAPVEATPVKPAVVPPPPPTLNAIATQLPRNAAEYAKVLRDIEEFELLPNTRDIFKQLTGEREIHSDSEDSMPDAYEYGPEEYDEDAPHQLPDEAYFMKNTPISVFQARVQESFKRSYDHAFAEQENIIAVMAQLQSEYLELEEEVAAREHRMPKRLRPLDSRVIFEDKKEADLYNYKYDPDPKKRGDQDPDSQRTDSVYVGGRELRGRARNREGIAAEFLQGRKKKGPAPASQIPRPAGVRGPGRPRKEVPPGTESGVTSVQPSRDASLDAAVIPQASPVKKGGRVIRNPRGYNGRNKPAAEIVSLPPTREPSPTPVVQAPPQVVPKKRGRKSNAEKAREAEAAAAAAAAAAATKPEPVKEIAPKQATPVVPSVQEPRRVSGRGRPPKVQPMAVEVTDAVVPQSAPATPSASASERQLPRPVTIKPAAPKPDATKSATPKSPMTKPAAKRREILKLRMSSGGSQKVEQILSPTATTRKTGEEKAAESSENVQTKESQELTQVDLKEETPVPALVEGPTAPEKFYGPATPTAVPSDGAASGPSSAATGNGPTPFTILPPAVPSSAPPPLQFVPSRIVSTPAPASPVAAVTPPAGSAPRQFFGNASRRARRGEFINSGVNNDSTPYKTYASGKVVGNAPVQVQMQDRAPSPEEPRASVPPQPAANVQLDFVMDMTVPQQLMPAPAPAPAPAAVPLPPPAPVPQIASQPVPVAVAPTPVPAAVTQPAQHIVATPKPRGRGGKSSSGAKGGGQSTFLPTITPDNWRLKKGVKQTVKTEGGSGPSPREGSVFRDMSGRATPTTSVGSTPITPSAPSFQVAEVAGQSQARDVEWMGAPMQTPPPPAPHMQMPPMTIPPMPNPPMLTAAPTVSITPILTPGMTGGYIHHLPPPSHHSAAPTLTPYIKPPVDTPVPPYGGHQLPPIQQLSFVNTNPGGAKPKSTRGKTYKKPTMGMDVPKPTKEDEFRALTGGQMDLGKRKRKGKGSGEGLGDVMDGPLAPVPGGYPGQGVIGAGIRGGVPPGSPKRIRFDSHMNIGSSQGNSQGYEGDMEMYQARPQQLPPPVPQQPYYPPPPHHVNQLPMPIQYYPQGPTQDLPPQAPAAPMNPQLHSRPTTSASEQTESQEQMERGETPQTLRNNSEEKVPGEGSFQINMWRPPIPGTIGA